ncbi:MAG: cysteine peptidase family C39 domain-containing protein [Planctomycetota bacterium]
MTFSTWLSFRVALAYGRLRFRSAVGQHTGQENVFGPRDDLSRSAMSPKRWIDLPTREFLFVVGLACVFATGSAGHLWQLWYLSDWSNWFNANSLPVSVSFYWTGLTPVLLAAAAGLAINAPGIRKSFRPWIMRMFAFMAASFLVTPMLRPIVFPVSLSPTSKWRDSICLQSHPASCAPAAAATLLAHHNEEFSEAELAAACLTSRFGTEPRGLYRGLATIAAMQGLTASIAGPDPSKWIDANQLPNVALIRFESIPGQPKSRLLGRHDEGHVVAVLGRTDGGRWIIGDPAVGRITWSDAELKRHFTGNAIYLR